MNQVTLRQSPNPSLFWIIILIFHFGTYKSGQYVKLVMVIYRNRFILITSELLLAIVLP